MSGFRGHIIAGSAAGVAVSVAVMASGLAGFPVAAASGAFCALMSLYPDTDIKSTSSIIVNVLGLALSGWLAFHGRVWPALTVMYFLAVPALCSHRGLMHSFPMSVVMPASMCAFAYAMSWVSATDAVILAVSGTAGYLTHLLMDT